MTPDEMKDRTKRFAVRIVKYVDSLPRGRSIDELTRQLVKAGTSVGANYRAACIARSKAEFVSKLQISFEEADEWVYWLEVLDDSGHSNGKENENLKKEGKEIAAILMASLTTSRSS